MRLERLALTLAAIVGFLCANVPTASAWWESWPPDVQYSTAEEACTAMAALLHIEPLGTGQVFGLEPNPATSADYICVYDRVNNVQRDPVTAWCPVNYYRTRNSTDGCAPLDGVPQPEDLGSCPAGPGNNSSALVGNPVNVANGNKFQSVVDYQSGGANPLRFVRYYNSGRATLGPWGLGWRASFFQTIYFDFLPTPNTITVYRPDGRMISFRKFSGIWYPMNVAASWFDRDIKATLVQDGSNWVFTDEDNTVETFGPPSTTDKFARLLSVRQRGGYQASLSYDASNRLASVVDSYNRQLTFAYNTAGLVTSMTDPAGQIHWYGYESPFSYSGTWRLNRATYPPGAALGAAGATASYHYENPQFPFALTGITDERGVRFATFGYDASLRANLTEHAGGADRITITYNADGTRTVTNPLGKQAIHRFATVQNRPKPTRIDGQASANCAAASSVLTYDSNGFVASRRDWNNNLTTYVNDSRGLETSRTEASGTAQARTITTTWHASYRVPTRIVEPGRTTDLSYDADGRLIGRTESDTTTQSVPYSTNGRTRTWTYGWTATGLLTSIDGPRTDVSDVTQYAYDAGGNLVSVTNALGHVTQITAHDAHGRPLTIVDPNTVTTTLAYNPRGWLTSHTVSTTAGSAITTFQYDAVGQITSSTLPDGSQLFYAYDDARRLTRISNSASERIDFTRDAMGNATLTETRDGSSTLVRRQQQAFDELGRLLRSIGAANQTTIYGYDNNGNVVTVTDPLSRITGQSFDALNRLIQATDALNGVTAIGYDARDRVVSVTDPRGVQTTYVHDGLGNVIQASSPDVGTSVFEYDAAGNRTRATDARGVVTEYAYDALNRLTAMTFPASPGENVAYSYDQAGAGNFGIGRQATFSDPSGSTAYTYDELGRTTQETRVAAAISYPIQYTYDLAGRITAITYPSGRIVDYSRDALGRVVSVATRADALATPVTVASGISYLPFGPVAGFQAGNGLSVTLTYDLDYRPTRILTSGPGTTIQDLNYSFDAASNITGITDARLPGRSQSFGYDALDRLVGAQGLYGTLTYGYDAVGNRTSRDLTGGAQGNFSETYGIAGTSNRLQSVTRGTDIRSFSYSASGQAVSDDRGPGQDFALVYDSRDRLTELRQASQTKAAYVYNAGGERVAKTLPGAPATVTHYLYDGDGQLIAEADGSGTTAREYIWLDGLPLAQIVGSQIYHAHADHLGTSQALTDGSQAPVWDAAYRPFGEIENLTASVSQNLRFPGQYADAEAGFHYNYFRDYDPTTGRYLQADPIGLEGGLNRYAYVGGNPVSWTDPSGEFAVAGVLIGAGADLAIQLASNGGRWQCVNWKQVGISAALGAVGGAWVAGTFKHATRTLPRYAWNWSAASRRMRAAQGIVGRQTDLHHWAIPRSGWGRHVPDSIKNRPWNLTPIDQKLHRGIHNSTLDPVQRWWHGTPNWAKAVEVSAAVVTAAPNGEDCTCGN